MAKNKMIALKAIKNSLGGKFEDKPIVLTFGTKENTVEVNVKPFLTIDERKDMVNGIVDMLFVEDGDGVVHYCTYLKKFAFEYHIVSCLTNIALPGDVDKIWDFLSHTDVARRVVLALPEGFVAEIIGEANEMIEFRKAKLEKQSKLDGILSGLAGLMNMVTEKLEGNDGEAIMAYLDKNMPDLKEQLSEAFKEQTVSDTAE